MPRRAVVLVPYLTHVEPACERGLRELERRGTEVRRFPATAAIDRTRSEMATTALRDGFDDLVWIDSDISFEPDDVARLRAHGLPIVGGIYAKKGVPAFALHLLPDARSLRVGEGGGLAPVRYLATGFLCTRREVYEDIQRHFSLPVCNQRFGAVVVPYFLPMVIKDGVGYWYLGVEYAFGERARLAGHATIADTVIRLGHIGSYAYSWEDVGQQIPRVTGAQFEFPPEEE